MKLRMLVAAVGFIAMPAMAHAQDTTAAPTSTGTDCPKKCPTSKGAAGLTGVQFLALQQELRDRDCGNAHVTGWLDAPTRRAIRKCAKDLGVANKAAAVLAAMNVGYSAADLGVSEAPPAAAPEPAPAPAPAPAPEPAPAPPPPPPPPAPPSVG
jgi:hypothetical protein